MTKHQARLKQADSKASKDTKKTLVMAPQSLSGLGKNTEMKRFFDLAVADHTALKVIVSHKERNKQKAEIIPKYMPYLNAYLSGEKRYKNPVLVVVMVWAFDCGDIELAMKLAVEAIKAKDEMPNVKGVWEFKSNLQDFVLDTLHEFLANELKAGRTVEPYLSTALEWFETIETFDQIKAKFQKLAGLHAHGLENWQAAIDHFEAAQELDKNIQVTTKLNDAKKKLNKQTGGNA